MNIDFSTIKTGNDFKVQLDMVKTGRNIKWAMKCKKIEPKQLAEALEFSTANVIYEWMKGDKLPNITNFFLTAKILGLGMDDLVAYCRIDKDAKKNIPATLICDDTYLNKAQNMECVIDATRKNDVRMTIKKFLADEHDFEDVVFWEPDYEKMSDMELGRNILEERLTFWVYAWERSASNKTTEHERKQYAQLAREIENLRLCLIPITVIRA